MAKTIFPPARKGVTVVRIPVLSTPRPVEEVPYTPRSERPTVAPKRAA